MDKKKIIIDCDPGVDDAAAILFALRRPEFDVIAITTVAGNGPLEITTVNALKLLELAGRADIPVYSGCCKPLKREAQTGGGAAIHGKDFMGDNSLPVPSCSAKEGAVDFMLKALEQSPGDISLITIGPMTNLGQAALKSPQVFQKTSAIYSMGGAVLKGNVTPVAEYNYWADPEAVEVVLNSGVSVHMLGLNVTDQLLFTPKHQELLKKGGKQSGILADMFTVLLEYEKGFSGEEGAAIHDLSAVTACLNPDIYVWKHCCADISTTTVTRGEVLADMVDAWMQPKNCYMATEVHLPEFFELFFHTMAE